MATPFSRTMRSVKSDGFRTALVGLSLGTVVLLLWLAWFFLARITLYETSQSATVSPAGEIVADFAPTALGRILPGQSALVRLGSNTATGLPQTVPAVVMKVKDETSRGRVRAELYMLDLPADLAAGQTGMTGQVEVEVEYVSPAVLVMRASGQFLHAPGVAVSPTDNQNVPGYP
jgi:hypothetical protein